MMRWGVQWIGVEIGALIVIAAGGYVLWDRHRYRGATKGSDSFVPTDEVFQDPVSGRRTRVYEDPNSGRRQYREEP